MDFDKNKLFGGVRNRGCFKSSALWLVMRPESRGVGANKWEGKPRLLESVAQKLFGKTTAFIAATGALLGSEVL